MLFQLQNPEFYKIVPKPEIIIYVYMSNQLHRVVTPVNLNYDNCFSIFYKQKNNRFIPKKRTFFTDKFLVHHFISNKLSWHFFNKFKFYNINEAKRFNSYLIESKKLVEKNWGKDVKFFILLFDDLESIEIEEELKKNGFIIISNKELGINLNNQEYKILNDNHPNADAWNTIVPILISKFEKTE